MLLLGGELDGVRVSTDGDVDRVIRHRGRWGHGFQLGGPPGVRRPMGTNAGPATFGHNGSSICDVWADPVRDLVVVHLTGLVTSREDGLRYQCELGDAILEASDQPL